MLVAIETTCRTTGVALFEGSELRAKLEREARGDVVLALVDELLRGAGIVPRDVERWAVDIGPGSFTGVRVGVATIKGLAFATGADVVGVSAFDALCAAHGADPKLSAAALEAGKGEVYYRLGAAEPSHAALEVVRQKAREGGLTLIGPEEPRAEAVGRVALTRSPDDIDRLAPLYVRAPDLTKPSP